MSMNIYRDGQIVTLTAEEAATMFPPVVPAVPEAVTAYQARVVLKAAGYLDAILAYRATLPASDDFALAWDTGAHVYRNSPLTLALMTTLDISPAEADQLFINAAGVT